MILWECRFVLALNTFCRFALELLLVFREFEMFFFIMALFSVQKEKWKYRTAFYNQATNLVGWCLKPMMMMMNIIGGNTLSTLNNMNCIKWTGQLNNFAARKPIVNEDKNWFRIVLPPPFIHIQYAGPCNHILRCIDVDSYIHSSERSGDRERESRYELWK